MILNINRKDIKTNLSCNYMSKKVTLLTLLSITLLISLSSALGDIGTVKQGNCIDLYNYCPTCSYVQLTAIKYPDGTLNTSISELMTKTEFDYNYTFCDTTMLGTYSYTTCGDKNGQEACEDITFESSPSGSLSESKYA